VTGSTAIAFLANTFVLPSSASKDKAQQGRRAALFQAVGAGALLPAVLETVTGAEQPAHATKAARFSGRYVDPKHIGCERRITKIKDKYEISGTSSPDGPNCEPGAKNLKKWFIYGETTPGEWPAKTLTIDFSNKGGPKGVVAKWVDGGIIFPDGNRWKKKPSPIMNEGQAGEREDTSAGIDD